jgi:hypothetical protein
MDAPTVDQLRLQRLKTSPIATIGLFYYIHAS